MTDIELITLKSFYYLNGNYVYYKFFIYDHQNHKVAVNQVNIYLFC